MTMKKLPIKPCGHYVLVKPDKFEKSNRKWDYCCNGWRSKARRSCKGKRPHLLLSGKLHGLIMSAVSRGQMLGIMFIIKNISQTDI